MKELLIATFLVMFSTSLQKESPGDVSPAEIFIANSEVKEGQEVRFKCKVTDVRTQRVYVHVCRSGTTVKTAELEESKNDIMFVFDKVTVKDSGLYTCVYSVEKDAACKMSRTGRNSASLEVYGEILPAKITGTQSSLREVRKTGENSIYVEVHDGGPPNTIILLIVALAFVLGIFIFFRYRDMIALRLCQNPDTSFNSGSETPAAYSLAQWCGGEETLRRMRAGLVLQTYWGNRLGWHGRRAAREKGRNLKTCSLFVLCTDSSVMSMAP
ncbi:hypothetical protein AOLI_G00093930 [Acnodon oligacanthus]